MPPESTEPEYVVIKFRFLPGSVPWHRRLGKLLKIALRSFGMKNESTQFLEKEEKKSLTE